MRPMNTRRGTFLLTHSRADWTCDQEPVGCPPGNTQVTHRLTTLAVDRVTFSAVDTQSSVWVTLTLGSLVLKSHKRSRTPHTQAISDAHAVQALKSFYSHSTQTFRHHPHCMCGYCGGARSVSEVDFPRTLLGLTHDLQVTRDRHSCIQAT